MTQPVRVQRQRTKGWRMPKNTAYVGRPTKFGNPFDWRLPIDGREDSARADAVALYRTWMSGPRGPFAATDADIRSLRGKNLACWCPLDQPCHADLLLKLANSTGEKPAPKNDEAAA